MAGTREPDKNVSYSSETREILQEERYLWMARAFVVMTVLAVICDIILLIALANVTPVLRVQPFYLDIQNKDQQIVNVKQPTAETLDSDALKESLVRQYLLSRLGIGSDLNELEERWSENGPVYWMSEPSVFEEFRDKEAVPLQRLAQQDNQIRNVQILKLNKTRSGQGKGADEWRAELEFRDMNRSSTQPQIRYFQADLATAFRPTRKGLTWERRLNNPLGFTVVDFGLVALKEKSKK